MANAESAAVDELSSMAGDCKGNDMKMDFVEEFNTKKPLAP